MFDMHDKNEEFFNVELFTATEQPRTLKHCGQKLDKEEEHNLKSAVYVVETIVWAEMKHDEFERDVLRESGITCQTSQ